MALSPTDQTPSLAVLSHLRTPAPYTLNNDYDDWSITALPYIGYASMGVETEKSHLLINLLERDALFSLTQRTGSDSEDLAELPYKELKRLARNAFARKIPLPLARFEWFTVRQLPDEPPLAFYNRLMKKSMDARWDLPKDALNQLTGLVFLRGLLNDNHRETLLYYWNEHPNVPVLELVDLCREPSLLKSISWLIQSRPSNVLVDAQLPQAQIVQKLTKKKEAPPKEAPKPKKEQRSNRDTRACTAARCTFTGTVHSGRRRGQHSEPGLGHMAAMSPPPRAGHSANCTSPVTNHASDSSSIN